LYKTVQKYAGQELSYRRWILDNMPFPSTCHFEYLCFGKRLDKRSRWSQLGNTCHEVVFKNTRLRGRVSVLQVEDEYARLSVDLGKYDACLEILKCIFEGFYSFRNFAGTWKYVPGISKEWFEYEPKKTEKKPVSPKNTHRSWNNTSKHNPERFARWIRTTVSDSKRREIRQIFLRSRTQQREAILACMSDSERSEWVSYLGLVDEGESHDIVE
jgi:hypothetical protein